MHSTSFSKFAVSGIHCAIVVASLLATGSARAESQRIHYVAATAVCASPLPQYDATLRKRPLGITNEGTTPIFISCSVPTDFYGDNTGTVNLVFTSFGAGATVNCTLVAGSRLGGTGSIAGSAVVAASGTSELIWNNVNKGSPYGAYNFSCNLPPGIELNTIRIVQFDADAML